MGGGRLQAWWPVHLGKIQSSVPRHFPEPGALNVDWSLPYPQSPTSGPALASAAARVPVWPESLGLQQDLSCELVSGAPGLPAEAHGSGSRFLVLDFSLPF